MNDPSRPGSRLSDEESDLLSAAHTARARALGATAAGAAVRTAAGAVYIAGSIDAPVASLSVCAGQLAIYRAVAAGEKEIVALARVRPDSRSAPCGQCLQTLLEFSPKAMVMWQPAEGEAHASPLADLLPLPFERF